MNFKDKLDQSIAKTNSLLCVGLDPDSQNLQGAKNQFEFNKNIIDQTADFVCVFKPQIAFYSAVGPKGMEDLVETIAYIRKNYSSIPILLDAKRGDVASTAQMYAKEVFDYLEADAVTVNPYLGLDAMEPFFQRQDKGIFVLCRTSNEGAKDFQDLEIEGEPLYQKIAQKTVEWNEKYKNLSMVVGATWPKQLEKIRDIAPNMTFLVPGVGAQGGDLKATLENGLTHDKKGLIISSSRGIIYDQDPRKAAQNLRDEINKYR